MKELANSIADYCKYLKDSGLAVSVHYTNETAASIPSEILEILRRFNSHTNPYCASVKRTKHRDCLTSQQSVLKSISSDAPFFRVCHAGVKEYIQPIFKGGDAIGFIAVSGYSDGVKSPFLKSGAFPAKLADTLIPPLKIMLEKLLDGISPSQKSEYNLIVQYLSEYYAAADLDSICRHFHRSPSHISHLFKQNSGLSLRAYCNNLKLAEARRLLEVSDLSITQIALDSGFNSVSHFINLFKAKYGISPLQYKKSRRFS